MITLILCSLASLALGVIAIWPTMISGMLFDQPGSEKNLALRAAVARLIAFPVCLILGSLGAAVIGPLNGVAMGWGILVMMWKIAGAAALLVASFLAAGGWSKGRKRGHGAG